MWEKLRSKNSITGIAAILLSAASFIAQFVLEGWTMQIEQWLSPLGIASMLLFVGGVVLIAWNFFRRDLRFPDKLKLMEERKIYLPKLKDVIQRRITRENEVAEIAIKTPLKVYSDKCLKNNPKYLRSGKPTDILLALLKEGFLYNNQYYKLLKDGDTKCRQTVSDYGLVYADIDKSKLKQLLDKFWIVKHIVNSADIMATLSKKNPKVRNYTTGYKIGSIGENRNKKKLAKIFGEITEYTKFLLRGGDL